MPTSQSSAATSSSADAPAIRTFQMDSGSIGNLSSSVNLFRGDVNLTQDLFTLPGRSQNNGLDINVSIQYQSNVYRSAVTWNREEPTGVLGLGWQFPLTYIEATDNGSPVSATRQYTLNDHGSANQLIRQPDVPLLFELDGSLAGQLQDGQPVPAAIQQAFQAQGLVLASSTRISGTNPWTLADDVNQQLYQLSQNGNTLEARDGGEYYQLENYQFWRVIYYPNYERWVVVTDNAVRRSFGSTQGNSTAWEVWWSNDGVTPQWKGTSSNTSGQIRVARAWYQYAAQDRFGNAVNLAYDQVTQTVGVGGLAYTKAIYLDRITDVFGRTVSLNYGEKLWSNGASDPREYADPNRAQPSNDPSPYQDRYETRYLDNVMIRDQDGTLLFTFQLTYAPRPELSGPERAVANVTDNTGSLRGDTFKRFLTSIVMINQDGSPQPGLDLTYYLEPGSLGPDQFSPGALASITYPQGGVATYTYQRQDLEICVRDRTVPRPGNVGQGATPRVFFGPDYSVVTYYNQSDPRLSMQVLTWAGSWLSWQLDETNPIIDTGGLDLSSLQVLADQDFFALSFDRTSPAEKAVYVFQKDVAKPGQWLPATIDGKTTAVNTPNLVYSRAGNTVDFAGGASFFIVSAVSASTQKGSLDRITFRWTQMAWQKESLAIDLTTWITAAGEYYATLDKTGQLRVSYLDGTLTWRDNSPVTLNGLNGSDPSGVVLVPGASLVAVSNLQSSNPSQHTYQIWIAAWNARYQTTLSTFPAFTDLFQSGATPTTFIPQVIADSFVAVNGNLLRYNGTSWQVNTRLSPSIAPANSEQRYAYGPDYALQIIVSKAGTGPSTAQILAFDPIANSDSWTNGPVTLPQNLPPQITPSQNWPSSGGNDWLVIGPYLYFRGTASNWGNVIAGSPIADLGSLVSSGFTLDSQSLVNQGPNFLGYSANSGSNTQQVQAILLENGHFQSTPVPFAGQHMVSNTSASSGISAKGPGLFVTFPASAASFDNADSLTLNQYAGNAVSGAIVHFAVAGLSFDDGFQERLPSAFVLDRQTAGCDPSGQVVKYFTARTYRGTDNPAVTPYGWTETQFLNGLNDLDGDNLYDMLDGMQISSAIYDSRGNLKQSTTAQYRVFSAVSSDPRASFARKIQLRGGWVAQTQEDTFVDGVTTTKINAFVADGQPGPFTSDPVLSQTQSYTGDGKRTTFSQATSFGVQFYSGLRAINALADNAQSIAANDTTTIQSTATTFSPWPSAFGPGVTPWASEATFGLESTSVTHFPFDTYRQGSTPTGWVLGARTTARTLFGQETENRDSLGIPTATHYSANSEFAIARVSNAPVGGFAYSSFQSYEETRDWSFSGVVFDDNNARIGTRSAKLPGGASAAIATTITIEARSTTYLMGCWYLTPSGFDDPNSGWTLRLVVDGVNQPVQFADFGDTSGAWTYRTLPIPIPASGNLIQLQLTTTNRSASDVWISNLLLVPLVNSLVARTFDPSSQQITSAMDASGRTSRTIYDANWQPTISVGASNLVRELSQRFLSRQGSPDGAFLTSSPNAELTLHATDGGTIESFRDGKLWQTRWSPSNLNSAWREGDGQLTHTTTSSDTLTWIGPATGTTTAIYSQFTASGTPDLSLTFGDITVGHRGGTYFGQQAGTQWTALIAPPTMSRQWLLVIGEGVVLFFAGGQLLFSQKTRPNGQAITWTTSGAPISFENLTILNGIRLGLAYNDGATRQRQIQQLNGADTVVTALVFDPVNRQIAQTRNAPGSYGSGEDLAVMQYSPDFLDFEHFLANTASTWEMRGDIADYYRGQKQGPYTRSNDEGYPYFGTRFEDSSRSTKLESSRPGKAYAINLTVPAESRQTFQFTWGTNHDDASLPAGEYFANTLISPVKTKSLQITDKLGQLVRNDFHDSSDQLLSATTASRLYLDDDGPTTTMNVRQPNATTPGPQQPSDSFRTLTKADGLQRTMVQDDPDAGQTLFVFDDAGHLRFVQPPLDPGEVFFIYYKYDPIGRMIEEGIVNQAWDRARLTPLANDPTWPTTDRTVAVLTSYDGDGNDPNLIGNKVSSSAFNPAPDGLAGAATLTVTDHFEYDAAGFMIAATTVFEGATNLTATVRYTYNVLSEVISLTLPEQAPVRELWYGRNQLGWLTAVGTRQGSDDLDAATYDSDGAVWGERMGGGIWNQINTFASPGWPLNMAISSADGRQNLTFQYDYAADQLITARKVVFNFSNYQQTYDQLVGYDGQRRMQSTTGTHAMEIKTYDPNGNIWDANVLGSTASFSYQAGSDRQTSATVDGVANPLSFNARGQAASGFGRSYRYDRATAMPTAVLSPTASLRFAFNGSQQRVLKQNLADGGSPTLTIWGLGTTPLLRIRDGAWSVLVQGPSGLLAQVGTTTRYVIKDTVQSTWALLDQQGLAAHYAYMPFGQNMDPDGVSSAFDYLYQGQEFDAEVGLYNFKARLYDPVSMRFLAPDPQGQFASLYVFNGNDPLSATDPTGEISAWAQVGIGAAMVVIMAIGVGLTLFTGGASDAAAAAADAALISGEGGGAAAGTTTAAAEGGIAAAAAGEGGAATADAGAGAAAAEAAGAETAAGAGAAEASSEVAAGASATEAAPAVSGTSKLTSALVNIASSTLMGAGSSGLNYDLRNGREFSAKAFFEAIGIGAASSFVGAGIGSAGGAITGALTDGLQDGLSVAARIAGKTLVSGISSVASKDVSIMLTNVAQHQPWYQGLAKGSAISLSKGQLSGAVSGVWSERIAIAKMAKVTDQTLQKVSNMVDRVKTAATSTDAYMVYTTAAFFMVSGFVVWGAASNWGRSK